MHFAKLVSNIFPGLVIVRRLVGFNFIKILKMENCQQGL